jgi:hypothetical protein
MKKLIAGILVLGSISSYASKSPTYGSNTIQMERSSDFYCSQAYLEKFQKLEKKRNWRRAGNIAMFGGVVAGASVALVAAAPLSIFTAGALQSVAITGGAFGVSA